MARVREKVEDKTLADIEYKNNAQTLELEGRRFFD